MVEQFTHILNMQSACLFILRSECYSWRQAEIRDGRAEKSEKREEIREQADRQAARQAMQIIDVFPMDMNQKNLPKNKNITTYYPRLTQPSGQIN